MTGLEALQHLKYGKKEKPYVEIIEQDLVTLAFIRSVWLSNEISEREAIEKVTEMLFSDKKWEKEVIENE